MHDMYKLTVNYHELFSPLTGKNVSWKRDIKKTLKKNIETHQNFTVFLKKGVEVLHEIQTP